MAEIDNTQGFIAGWNLEPDNNTGFPDGSPEAKYWPVYREFYYMMQSHAELKDIKGLRWHKRCFQIILNKINEMIIDVDKDDK